MTRFEKIYNGICNKNLRSCWQKGVKTYALELMDGIEEAIDGGYESDELFLSPNAIRRVALNGAENWKQYSEGGCALIYDRDIAKRLCNKTELKQTRNGERRPNPRESWIDVQARALSQACSMIQIEALNHYVSF